MLAAFDESPARNNHLDDCLIKIDFGVTMETELPELFSRRAERFTFHSARMRMQHVTPDALATMDAESDRCALELADARVDVLGYACLVAIMASGPTRAL